MKDDSPTEAARRIIAFNAMNGNADNTSIDEVAVARAYLRAVEALEGLLAPIGTNESVQSRADAVAVARAALASKP